MTDVTVSPLATPTDQPQRDATGTLLNQATTESTKTDSSQTTQEPPKTETKAEPSTPDTSKSALNKDDKGVPQGAPEKYTDFKLPEGLKLQPEILAEAAAVFKNLNLSQDAAQSLVDFHAKQIATLAEAPFRAVTDLKNAWETDLKSTYGKDLEPGGKVITSISRMIDTLPPTIASGFREAMDLTLAGSNPAFVAAFYELSQRQAEGKAVKGNGPSPGGQAATDVKPKSVAQALYPHLKSASDTQ